jgi:hypothetical protein
VLEQARPKLLIELHSNIPEVGGGLAELGALLGSYGYTLRTIAGEPVADLSAHARDSKMIQATV